jgi:hypothetical protein
MHALRLFFALALAILPVRAVYADDTYEVRLHRPVKTGDRFRLDAKVAVDMSTKTIFNADEVEEETVVAACKLTGEVTVVEATAKGLVKELRLKLSNAECINDGEDADFFKAGDVIHIRHAQPDAFIEINGLYPDQTQLELINTFLYVQGDENSTDDELLGAPGKVKPGESWGMNKDAVLKDWIREGFDGLKAEDLKGKTTLTEITKFEGQPALRLQGEFQIENAGLKIPSLPEEMRAKRFKLEIKDETEMPLDPGATSARSKTHMNIESDSDGTLEQDGVFVKVRVNLRQRCAAELSITPLKETK